MLVGYSMNRVSAYAVTAAIVAFVGIIIWLGSEARSTTETALASVLLTLVSIGATWIVSHYYYLMTNAKDIERVTIQHDESLKTYARKAAEKVTNLSRELSRLSGYLREYLDYESSGDSLEVVLGVRDERLSGAIHIVEMLRSVNDTSLSDWYGVIGEELEKKKEHEDEIEARREKTIIEAIDKLGNMIQERAGSQKEVISEANIIARIEEMRSELTTVALGLRSASPGRSAPTPIRARPRMYLPCPACQSDIEIENSRAGKVKFKAYACSSCHTRVVVRPTETGEPMIALRGITPERVLCPKCETPQTVELDNVAGATAVIDCVQCAQKIRASRGVQGITCTFLDGTDQALLAAVKQLLPPQPWPKGIHAEIAAKLGGSAKKVQKAINHLIETGVFRPQINGVLYEPRPVSPNADATSNLAEKSAPDRELSTVPR
jgi:ssDNA-binding Zn-finger/Zn-ribbon topoisomerase 1